MATPRFVPALSNVPLIHQGKTRDTYEVRGDNLLIYATDRLSTHNVVHMSTVPKKGEVLTAMTAFWLSRAFPLFMIPHHVVAGGRRIFDYLEGAPEDYPADLCLRAIVVKRLTMIPVEFIYRNYMAGSLYDKFYSKGLDNPYGIEFAPGLELMSKFTEPLFTPTDKSETDDPLDARAVEKQYYFAEQLARRFFSLITGYLKERNITFVDSKFELGIDTRGAIFIADEIATPDSSRYARAEDVRLGHEPSWLDKQVARNEAIRMWNGGPKVPLEFSPDIINQLSETYLKVFEMVTGQSLGEFQKQFLD